MARGDLSGQKCILIESLLTAGQGGKSRSSLYNRQYLNGMLHVLRVDCPWCDMHERCGKWKLIDVRFRRWAEQGIWYAL
ncbi:transposase [Brucella sp. TWI432]